MRKLFNIAMLVVVLLAGLQVDAFSQATQPTKTTLSAALNGNNVRFTVASATGFVASNTQTGLLYGALIDHEFILITGVTGTTITGTRGYANTNQTPHKSGAYVVVGQLGNQQQSATQIGGPFVQTPYQGSCTATNYPYLPLIQVNANAIGGQAMYNCLNGEWYKQDLIDDAMDQTGGATQAKYCTIDIGSVAYGSLGTATSYVAGTVYVGSVYVPTTFVGTGIQVMAAGTTGTSLVIFALYDAGGRRIATSALAGGTLTSANALNSKAFTTSQIITGPARYFIAVQGNVSTDNFRTVATATFVNLVGNSRTGTFGTLPTLTMPTTLTADTAPVGCVY